MQDAERLFLAESRLRDLGGEDNYVLADAVNRAAIREAADPAPEPAPTPTDRMRAELDALAAACDYDEEGDSPVDNLIDYKNAVEELAARLLLGRETLRDRTAEAIRECEEFDAEIEAQHDGAYANHEQEAFDNAIQGKRDALREALDLFDGTGVHP